MSQSSSSAAQQRRASSSPAAARLRPSTRSSTPSSLQRAQRARAGTPPAASTCTSSVSAALHTPGRWVLALTMIRSAASRSALGVDVDVAVARRGVDHRHRRDALERVLQALAAARDDEVDDPVLGRELRELLAAAAGDQGDRALGQAGGLGGVGRDAGEHGVRVRRRRRAAQHDGVARLQAQRGGVDRDVRARLVDDGDHAQRHADLAHVQAVRQPEAVDDLADRVGQRRDRAHAGGDPGDARARRARGGRAAPARGRSRGPRPCRGRWPRGSPACGRRARRRSRAARSSSWRCRASRAPARRPGRCGRGRRRTGR